MARCRSSLILVLLVSLFATAPAAAGTKVVTFDDVLPGTPVSNQYKESHGVYWRGPDTGDGWFPVVRSAPGIAHSGSHVADVATCTALNCEGFTPSSTGRLVETATTVGVYVGY